MNHRFVTSCALGSVILASLGGCSDDPAVVVLTDSGTPQDVVIATDNGAGGSDVVVAAALQSSGGVHRTPGTLPLSTQGTAIFMRLRNGAGAPPTAPVTVTVTGPMAGNPLGWNAGAPLTLTYPMGSNFFGAYPAVAPVTGNYTLQATVDGAPVTSNFNLDSSASPALEPSASLTLANVGSAQVDGTWAAVTGAVSYRFAVRDTSTTPPTIVKSVRVTTTTASLTGLTLDTSRTTYDAEVLAYPVDLSPADVATPPAPFNVSFRRVAVTFP